MIVIIEKLILIIIITTIVITIKVMKPYTALNICTLAFGALYRLKVLPLHVTQ